MNSVYVLFFSTNHAMWAEAILSGRGIAARVVPVPRHLSSDCGYCLEIPEEASGKAAAILEAEAVEFDRIGR